MTPPPALPAEITRYDLHQRLQYAGLLGSTTLLILTGWPLTTHGHGASRHLVDLFGGPVTTGILHRIAATGLILAALYHGLWLTSKLARRELRFSMVPGPSDVAHIFQNMLYFMGIRRERPHFGRYTYLEKFDYWAALFGVAVVTVTGALRWLPDWTARLLPAWTYEIALFAHTEQGLLLALALCLWHLYHAHLRPTRFPLSRPLLTGQMTLRELAAEHPAEYAALRTPAPPAKPDPAEPAADPQETPGG